MNIQRTKTRILVGAAALGGVSALLAPASASASASVSVASPASVAAPAQASASADSRVGQPQGGTLVSVKQVADFTAEQVAAELSGEIDVSRVRYGVTAYQVLYRTTNSAGAPTTASQLLVLPKNRARHLSTVSWLHGTTVYRKDVASENPKSTDRLVALLFASTGRAVSAPDYVGLGAGEGFHPYGDPLATVSASVDGLRAARTVAHRSGRELKRKVQVSGFSQGGPATMMVGRALQQESADRYFRLGALAPVGGPFNLSAFEAAAANDEIEDKSALYLVYFATAWNKTYGLYKSPSEAFTHDYAGIVEGLLNGNTTTDDIAKALPGRSALLFQEDFLNKIRKPEGILKEKLRALDTTCDWRPNVPVEIFHAMGDKDVNSSHAAYCADQLTSNGAASRVTDVGDYDHNGSVRQAVPRIVDFFDASAKTGEAAVDRFRPVKERQ
ncbi:lipase family protein [Streptomyces sp. NPDC051561]|uniref:lipase family protein n=1 Tax=Streptomyces sp. NPDC051561 TaxID=3365658 RepID=UPI0037BB76A8